MAREQERFNVGADPIRICYTSHDRTPYITNVCDVPIMLDVQEWPADKGLTLQPGVTIPFVNPFTPRDATPVFASAPSGNGEVEYWFAR